MHGIDTPFLVQVELRESAGHAAERAWFEAQLAVAQEVKPVFPSQDSSRFTLQRLRHHRLDRKRLVDTQLAASYFAHEITRCRQ